jgi:hypothetical protein
MKIRLALIAISTLPLTGCATKMSTDKNAPTGPRSATVTVEESQVAYWVSAKGGEGTITYKGETREFSIVGLGAGGTGLQTIKATGEVYNLTSLSDFPGNYSGLRFGFTFIKGKMHAKLTNERGVVLYLTGKARGLASSSGADRFVIKMKESPQTSSPPDGRPDIELD